MDVLSPLPANQAVAFARMSRSSLSCLFSRRRRASLVGALSAKYLFTLLRIDSWAVRGFALGTTSHGIGAARALQVHDDAGAYAGIALGLQVLLASLLIPLMFRWLG